MIEIVYELMNGLFSSSLFSSCTLNFSSKIRLKRSNSKLFLQMQGSSCSINSLPLEHFGFMDNSMLLHKYCLIIFFFFLNKWRLENFKIGNVIKNFALAFFGIASSQIQLTFVFREKINKVQRIWHINHHLDRLH